MKTVREIIAEERDPADVAAGMIEKPESLLRLLKKDMERLEKGIALAQSSLKGYRKAGAGATVAVDIVDEGDQIESTRMCARESDMDEFKGLMERGADIVEAVRPLGQPDVGVADDEVSILFEAPEDAQVIYDLLVGTTTGIKLLLPGEVVLRVVEGWNQVSLNFAPHVRYLKPEIIAAVFDAIRENVAEDAMAEADAVLREDMVALVEFNTWHTYDDGKFSSREQLARAKKGSYSDGRRKNKVSGKGKGKTLKLVATSHPCGRAARDSGSNQRCWDGQKVDWTGHAVARVIKKAKKTGRVEGALTRDDLIILERAARVLNARVEIMGEAKKDKKMEAAVMKELGLGEERRSVGELLSELGGQTFGRSSRGRDPYWMTAKYAGKAKDGTPFKKGDKVFYYPATKTILAGAEADKAARDFQAAVDDERQYNSGM